MTRVPDMQDLTCREVVEIVTDYLEGRLSAGERLAFEEHLVMCAGCTAYLEQMRQTIRITGALREERLPDAVKSGLLEAFRDWKRGGA
jgi:anti-sigma factor RsiW